MTKDEIIEKFLEEVATYGKLPTSDITVARAVEVLKEILKDEEYIYRNNTRKKENNKDISLGVIKSMLKKYTPPNKEEGFDLCIYV